MHFNIISLKKKMHEFRSKCENRALEMLGVIISYILRTQAANEYLTAHTTYPPKIKCVLNSTVCKKKGDINLYQSAKPNRVCKMCIDF